MAKVEVHYRDPKWYNWKHDTLNLERVPCVGEYIQVGGVEGSGCKVLMVMHHVGFSDVFGEYAMDFEKITENLVPFEMR